MRRRDECARRYLRPRRRRVAERFRHDALGEVAAPDAHERAIIERILAEKAVQLEATHDHLVANLAMYQPPQPPPAAHSSSQYFCQR